MKKLVLTLAVLVPFVACKPKTEATTGDAAAAATGSATTTSLAQKVQNALTFVTGGPFEGEITMQMTDAGKPPNTITYMVKGQKMRFDAPAGTGPAGDNYVIFDGPSKKMTTVTESKKMAFVMDMNGMGQGPGGMAAANAAAATKPNVEKTGKEDTVAGYSCEEWKITESNGDKSDVCVAKGIAFPMIGKGGPSWAGELGGDFFPLRVVTTDPAGKEKSKMEVTKIEKKSIDDKKLEVPADYKTMNMGDMMKSLGGMHGGMPGMMGHRPPH